jgi:isopentenyl phosphate kinase
MLAFLKLGGSLITDKNRPYTPRLDMLDDLSAQIAAVLKEKVGLSLIIGHGSGSFGHQAASLYGTRNGVAGEDAWRGFTEVWYQASTLNRLVLDSFHRAGLPAITLSPAASVTSHEGKVIRWDLYPLETALSHGLLPVIHGDVIFDDAMGGTILSTEDLFVHLARKLRPDRILLAGLEAGVWEDFPQKTKLIREMTPNNDKRLSSGVGGSAAPDVTGGMAAKVTEMLSLVEQVPGIEVLIFSGEKPDNVRFALRGATPGTLLHC